MKEKKVSTINLKLKKENFVCLPSWETNVRWKLHCQKIDTAFEFDAAATASRCFSQSV